MKTNNTVQTFNFRWHLRRDTKKKRAVQKPDNNDPAETRWGRRQARPSNRQICEDVMSEIKEMQRIM